MADPIILASPKRVNVSPTTDVLYLRVDDVDCTDSNFDAIPEDGQFVLAHGPVATNPQAWKKWDNNNDGGKFQADAPADVTFLGAGLAMVWSGGASRTDMQALIPSGGKSSTRVPVLRGPARVKTKLFHWPDPAVPLVVGAPVTVVNAATAGAALAGGAFAAISVQGSTKRYILTPLVAGNAGWAVGYIVRVISNSTTGGTGEIEVQLYDKPVMMGV